MYHACQRWKRRENDKHTVGVRYSERTQQQKTCWGTGRYSRTEAVSVPKGNRSQWAYKEGMINSGHEPQTWPLAPLSSTANPSRARMLSYRNCSKPCPKLVTPLQQKVQLLQENVFTYHSEDGARERRHTHNTCEFQEALIPAQAGWHWRVGSPSR